jgi:Concanavalin A-like lectin/glucanases superfamily
MRISRVFVILLLSISTVHAGRNFNGSSQYLSVGTPVFTSYPHTVCGWFRAANTTAAMTVFGVGDSINAQQHWYVGPRGDQVGDPLWYTSVTTGGSTAATTTSFVATTWQHFCGVGRATNSRDGYLNGGGKGSDTGAQTLQTGMTQSTIGRRANTETIYFAGDLSHLCIWTGAASDLNDLEVAALASGVPCTKVRPDKLVSCPILFGVDSPEGDACGARSWTLTAAPGASTTNPPVPPLSGR